MIRHSSTRDVTQKAKLYLALVKAQKSGKPVPVVANLFLTGKCNCRCRYCYVDIDTKPQREFDLPGWLQLVDDLYDRGCRYIAIVGGEPLLYPHVDELLEHIAKKNIFLNLATNATLIYKHMDAARMATEISVSLDGNPCANDKNRGEGNFDKAMAGIDKAIDAGMKVRLCTVVTRHNADQIDFLLDYCERRNVFITFSPLMDAAEVRKDQAETMRLTDEEIREFFLKLRAAKQRSSRIINSHANIDYMVNYPVQYGEIVWRGTPEASYSPKRCPYGRFQYLISNVGEVYPCCVMWNNEQHFRPVNILEHGLDCSLDNASKTINCQCCSFGNAADWNNITSLPWLWYGVKMTALQAFGRAAAK